MKKISIFLILLLAAINFTSAHASKGDYKNCFLKKRYQTMAEAYCWYNYEIRQRKQCGLCKNMCFSEAFANWTAISGAHAVSWIGPGGGGYSCAEAREFECGSGFNRYKVLNSEKENYSSKLPSDGYASPPPNYLGVSAKDSFGNIVYNAEARTITLKNYTASLRINQENIENWFANLTIQGLYNTQEDTLMDNDSIFYEINIYLQGSSLLISSNNSIQFLNTINTPNTIEYRYVGGDLVINVPPGIDFEKIGFRTSVDAGPANNNAPFVLSGEKDLQNGNVFQIKNMFPNPTTDIINLNIYASQNSINTISFIDITGKRVFFEQNVRFEAGDNFKQINAENLKAGQYILIINDGKNNHEIKFLKK